MKLCQYLHIFLFFILIIYCDSEDCYLTQTTPVNVNNNPIYSLKLLILIFNFQPFPNLKKCYKHNEAACCNIINDATISEYIQSYIPEDCLRLFPELEDLLCFGCSSDEANFRDDDNMEIRICKSFAEEIWKGDLNEPSTRFDGCGLLSEDNNFSKNDEDEFGYIIPSKVFSNFEEFINALKIPYYEEYKITYVDDGDDCFNDKNYIKDNIFIFLMIILIFL